MNQIEILPTEIGQLELLTELHLDRNRLSRWQPEIIANARDLKDLYVGELSRYILPRLPYLKGFYSRRLYQNKLTSFSFDPDVLSNLTLL